MIDNKEKDWKKKEEEKKSKIMTIKITIKEKKRKMKKKNDEDDYQHEYEYDDASGCGGGVREKRRGKETNFLLTLHPLFNLIFFSSYPLSFLFCPIPISIPILSIK